MIQIHIRGTARGPRRPLSESASFQHLDLISGTDGTFLYNNGKNALGGHDAFAPTVFFDGAVVVALLADLRSPLPPSHRSAGESTPLRGSCLRSMPTVLIFSANTQGSSMGWGAEAHGVPPPPPQGGGLPPVGVPMMPWRSFRESPATGFSVPFLADFMIRPLPWFYQSSRFIVPSSFTAGFFPAGGCCDPVSSYRLRTYRKR